MKSNLGQLFRKIRMGKQISINSIADNTLSKSQISRFERGESEISCLRLIHLLDKLNISLSEFVLLTDEYYSDSESFTGLSQYIRQEYAAQRIDNLKALLTNKKNKKIGPLEATMIKSLISTMDSSFRASEEEMNSLVDYLFKVEVWGYYELTLFGNCVRSIKYSSFFLLTKEMLKKSTYSSLNKINKRAVTQLAINCFISSIDHQQFKDSLYLQQKIEELLKGEFNFYEQTVFLYTQGYLEIKQQKNSGFIKMQNAIQVFQILNEIDLKRHYDSHYQSNI